MAREKIRYGESKDAMGEANVLGSIHYRKVSFSATITFTYLFTLFIRYNEQQQFQVYFSMACTMRV